MLWYIVAESTQRPQLQRQNAFVDAHTADIVQEAAKAANSKCLFLQD